MKEQFFDKIDSEYQEYKEAVLSCSKSEIYEKCYEIDIITNIREILIELGEEKPDCVPATLISRPDILMELYAMWLKKDDSIYSELTEHVKFELRKIGGMSNGTDKIITAE